MPVAVALELGNGGAKAIFLERNSNILNNIGGRKRSEQTNNARYR